MLITLRTMASTASENWEIKKKEVSLSFPTLSNSSVLFNAIGLHNNKKPEVFAYYILLATSSALP